MTAVAVLGEAAILAALLWVLGLMVRRQEMTLDGISPTVLTGAAWGGAALLATVLLAGVAVLLRATFRDRLGGRPSRALLIAALVIQAVLGTLAVGLVGWWAFAAAMALFGMLLLALVTYPPPQRAPETAAARPDVPDVPSADGAAGPDGAGRAGADGSADELDRAAEVTEAGAGNGHENDRTQDRSGQDTTPATALAVTSRPSGPDIALVGECPPPSAAPAGSPA